MHGQAHSRLQKLIDQSLLDIDRLLTRELFQLQVDISQELKYQESKLSVVSMHKDQAFSKIDWFFNEMKE